MKGSRQEFHSNAEKLPKIVAGERQKCFKPEKENLLVFSPGRVKIWLKNDKNQILKQGKVGGFQEIGTQEISRVISLADAWYLSYLSHPSNGCHTCSQLAFLTI